MNALLIGAEPPCSLGYTYVTAAPYDAVVIGSLTLSQLLYFSEEAALSALAQGKQVILYEPGLPEAKANRALSAALSSRRRELKSWGVVFTDGGQRKVITAQQAQKMLETGEKPAMGAVLTPLAKEILNL
ncbi:MAG: hypothetical protein IJZ56_05560 [Oscillospiraceae bacterium]|nr:hypothetical protein [Oscillospiraceae bacterium]